MICLSVIIPVYNVEEYIDDCIKSVLNQTYTNIDIVLVDDGSTDGSGIKCDEWAQKDTRICVVHKENGGLSDARNAGIKHAIGSYVLFLDSDDFWDDDNAIARLMQRIELTKADVLNFFYKKYYEDTQEKKSYFKFVQAMPIGLYKKEQLKYLMQHGLFIASACNKLVKKSLLDDEKLMFRKDVFSEDIEWCANLLCRAESMDFIPEDFYCYRQRSNSISNKITDKKCRDLHDNLIRCFELLESVLEDVRIPLCQYVAYQYGTFFAVQAQAEHPQAECLRSLKQYKWILRYHGGNAKVRLLYYSCNIMGYGNTCRLMRCLYRKK